MLGGDKGFQMTGMGRSPAALHRQKDRAEVLTTRLPSLQDPQPFQAQTPSETRASYSRRNKNTSTKATGAFAFTKRKKTHQKNSPDLQPPVNAADSKAPAGKATQGQETPSPNSQPPSRQSPQAQGQSAGAGSNKEALSDQRGERHSQKAPG